MQIKKKIAYISGTRADFGLIAPVLKAVEASNALALKVYATGMHLMPLFGETLSEVKKVFPNAGRIEAVIESDGRESMAAFAGALLPKVVEAFTKDRPYFVLILGDRVEMLVVALACLYLGIPTGHLHGGERTATVDESARHAISKLVSLHFASTKNSAERLKKMGEDEWRIHIVGAPALDSILHAKLPEKEGLCAKLGLDAELPFILVVQHPVSEELDDSGKQMQETLTAVKSFGLPVVVIYPNADAGGKQIITEIEKERQNPLFHIFRNVPHADFLALEREAAVWVGNSSGALIESSLFGTPVVNVGTRQRGRERGGNVIDVGYDREEIRQAIEKSLTDMDYRASLKKMKNPWGDGKTGARVAKILEQANFGPQLLSKQIAY